MQFDETLARELLTGNSTPTIRVFRWKPWAISIGFNQNVSDLDLKKCDERRIDVVRRPTGGRAILHAEELTYSVAMYADNKSILELYNSISKGVIRGLGLFGVDTSFQRLQPNFNGLYKKASAVPCFASSAMYEIEVNGRKLVGSAQRRYRDGIGEVVLQHGSILTGPAHRQLVDYLTLPDVRTERELESGLKEKTIDLSEILGHPVDHAELACCIRSGFELEWGIKFLEDNRPVQVPKHAYA